MFVFATDLEKGMHVCIEGCPYVVVDFRCVKPGKGASFIQVDLRSALSDTPHQIRLHPFERLERIDASSNQCP